MVTSAWHRKGKKERGCEKQSEEVVEQGLGKVDRWPWQGNRERRFEARTMVRRARGNRKLDSKGRSRGRGRRQGPGASGKAGDR